MILFATIEEEIEYTRKEKKVELLKKRYKDLKVKYPAYKEAEIKNILSREFHISSRTVHRLLGGR